MRLRLLVNEAKKRQVIVFTHDMPFLYLLLNLADNKEVNKNVHWIKRGDEDNKPGYVWLNNCPALEGEYKAPKVAKECLEDAKKESNPRQRERILKDGFGALRTTFEAFIVFEILNGVVLRFEERISFGRLEEIYWDNHLVNEVVRTCERLSRYIEGHLHSDALATVTELTPQLLNTEIEGFYKIRKKLKDLKKS